MNFLTNNVDQAAEDDGPLAADGVGRPPAGEAAEEGDEAEAADQDFLLHLVDVEVPLNEQNATAHHTNI